MKTFDTLVEALDDLKERGFTTNFDLKQNCIECDNKTRLEPKDFNVVEVYRFEGMTSVDDSSILFAIEANDGRKGVLIDAYGVYADNLTPELIAKLDWRKLNNKQE